MTHTCRTLVALFAGSASAFSALAQTGEYYLAAPNQRQISVTQGLSTVRQWTQDQTRECPIAVAGDVRTAGVTPNDSGTIYNHAGGVTGGPLTAFGAFFYDSTSDGTNHYLVEFNSGDVYRTDNTYQNPTFLFSTGENDLGITYDAGTLWISNYRAGTRVKHYDMSGVLLGSFSTGHQLNVALAFDQLDGTLWLRDENAPGTYEQWTTSGTPLYRGGLGAVGNDDTYGGEFSVPAPGSLALLALGGLAASRRRRA